MRMVLEIIQGASHFVSGSSAVLAGEIALSQIHENAALKRTGIAGRDVGSLSWLHWEWLYLNGNARLCARAPDATNLRVLVYKHFFFM